MLTPPISPAWPIQLLNTRLCSYACGPRHWLREESKCLVKGRRDFVARSLLRLFLNFPFFQRGSNWLLRSCSCVLNPLDQVRRALVLECHELKPVRTPVAILGSLGVCIYVSASRHWLISYSPIHLT